MDNRAESILNKIRRFEYPSDRSNSIDTNEFTNVNTQEDEQYFLINNDMNFSNTVLDKVIQNRLQRTELVNIQKSLELNRNLMNDSHLDYYVNKVNEEVITDRIIPNTRFKVFKRFVMRLFRMHTRLQNTFNQNVAYSLKIIVNKLGDFYKLFVNETEELINSINEVQNESRNIKDRLNTIEANNESLILKEINEVKNEIKDIVDKLNILESDNNSLKLNERISDLEELKRKFKEKASNLTELGDKLANEFENLNTEVISSIEKIHSVTDDYSKEIDNVSNWVKTLDNRLAGNEKWLSLISQRIEEYEHNFSNLRKELFFETRDRANHELTPRIVNSARYADKLIKSGGKLKIQLGAGMDKSDEYISIDIRELPEVDIVAEATNLPFSKGSISEIFNAHLLEHFTQMELKKKVLPYWYKLIENGGILRIVTPNIGAMILQYTNQKIDFSTLAEVVFGGQEYKGNYHFSMFSTNSISDLLKTVGFTKVEIIAEDRVNGQCLEMEILAHK